jgi:hypothetical protein
MLRLFAANERLRPTPIPADDRRTGGRDIGSVAAFEPKSILTVRWIRLTVKNAA